MKIKFGNLKKLIEATIQRPAASVFSGREEYKNYNDFNNKIELGSTQLDNIEEMPKAACCFIKHPSKDLVLAVTRGTGNEELGLPGGKVEPGEDIAAAAIRELEEETGLVGLNAKPIMVFHPTDEMPSRYEVHIFEVDVDNFKTIKSSEEGDVVWATWQDLINKSPFKQTNIQLFNELSK